MAHNEKYSFPGMANFHCQVRRANMEYRGNNIKVLRTDINVSQNE